LTRGAQLDLDVGVELAAGTGRDHPGLLHRTPDQVNEAVSRFLGLPGIGHRLGLSFNGPVQARGCRFGGSSRLFLATTLLFRLALALLFGLALALLFGLALALLFGLALALLFGLALALLFRLALALLFRLALALLFGLTLALFFRLALALLFRLALAGLLLGTALRLGLALCFLLFALLSQPLCLF